MSLTDDAPLEVGYPFHLAGDDAPPPEPVAPRIFDMALRAEQRLLEAAGPPLETAAPWRSAAAIEQLFAEADAAAPKRARASDGRKGNAAHEKLGRASDHNPWLIHQGRGIVRAADITNDPALDLPGAFERARRLALAGKLPQLLHGGYLILNGRITRPDFTGWAEYKGTNKHVAHGHASVSLNPAQFDLSAPWGVFAAPPAPTPRPAPPRPAPGGWPGPDLRGAGAGLRGDQGDNGPRVLAWQQWLNRHYPAYSKLAEDGEWGPQTTAVNREFGRRSGVPSADGLNIGPKLAAAYWRAGLFRRLSAARERAVGHVARAARR